MMADMVAMIVTMLALRKSAVLVVVVAAVASTIVLPDP